MLFLQQISVEHCRSRHVSRFILSERRADGLRSDRKQNLRLFARQMSERSNSTSFIAVDSRNKEFVLFREGTMFRFASCAKAIEQGSIRVVDEVLWDLREISDFAKYIHDALRRFKHIELAEVLSHFNSVVGELVYDCSVSGFISPYRDDEKETFACLKDQLFGGTVECIVELTDEELSSLQNWGGRMVQIVGRTVRKEFGRRFGWCHPLDG
jgi:hypothetical protein